LIRWVALLVVLGLAGCKSKSTDTVVRVEVTLAGGVPVETITLLRATVEELVDSDAARRNTREYGRRGGPPLAFPATLSIVLGRDVPGPVLIDLEGVDATGDVVARGSIPSQAISAGGTTMVTMQLGCAQECAGGDGGVRDAGRGDARDGPTGDLPPACGNGLVDPGETCDIAIMAGQMGACPPASCDDTVACTRDTHVGEGCTARCVYEEITALSPTDGCCPTGADHTTDPDCSVTCGNGMIEAGETCDTAIAAGQLGACPSECDDPDSCTRDLIISARTCSARCLHLPITMAVANDKCCPAGANNAKDPDCPVVCGNGLVESSETCDTAIPAGLPGSCPTPCPPHDLCQREFQEGSGCRAVCRTVEITDFVMGDGCCPKGGNGALDPDCRKVCGNGVVEPNEQCDKAISADQPGACPAVCMPARGCMPSVMQGSPAVCTAHCVPQPITACSPAGDGCCPDGCTTQNDPDCSPTCGNGLVEPGETCDTAIPQAMAGSCPQTCDDSNNCTSDVLLSKDTCNARCQFTPKTTYGEVDGCCPLGGNHNVDSDCPFRCGNGVVEGPKETCDTGIPAPAIGSCPVSCPAPSACQQYLLSGDAGLCTARCEAAPITACHGGDDCCPTGCNHANDADCVPVCGNGVVESPEQCDKAITAGKPGACAASCDDNNNCTDDSTSGSVENCTRSCSHAPITACAAGDHCCPGSCTGDTDSDCVPVCPNGLIESGESCDPPASCPTTCPDDGDACTEERLDGVSSLCTLRCLHVPRTSCSGATHDQCCPTGCVVQEDSPDFDVDCPAASATPDRR
jgi:hypothetical protein